MITVATQDSWKTLPLPTKREALGFKARYSEYDFKKMRLGLVPEEMEDKWFIYFQDGWLYFHRSWTGVCIYGLRLEPSLLDVGVIDSWVNRDPEEYRNLDLEYDRKLVAFLIAAFLLGQDAQLPGPGNPSESIPDVYQHQLVGRAYPAVEHPPPSWIRRFWRRLRQ